MQDDEKETKSLRKQIQEKLIKFATRIPVFMYLSDYREHSMEDVIRNLESGLFRKVTGLEVKDFGCDSEASCDYPIYGKAVAEAVARAAIESGVARKRED